MRMRLQTKPLTTVLTSLPWTRCTELCIDQGRVSLGLCSDKASKLLHDHWGDIRTFVKKSRPDLWLPQYFIQVPTEPGQDVLGCIAGCEETNPDIQVKRRQPRLIERWRVWGCKGALGRTHGKDFELPF